MKHARKGSSGNKAVIAAFLLVIVIIAIILLVVFAVPNSPSEGTVGTSAQTTGEVTTVASSVTTEALPITTEITTVAVTEATTPPPVTTTPPPATQPTTTTTTAPPPPPSTTDRNTDFSGCLFIGDSRTQGLMMYSGVQGATAYASRGLMVDTFFTTPVVDMNGSKVSVADAVSANNGFKYVYIMFGINELGWPYEQVFIDRYAKVVDHVKAAMPNAKVIVQSIIPVTASRSASDDVFNNPRVTLFNSLIKGMCAEKGVTYFDLVPVLGTAGGALPEEAAFDGIHLQKSYCQKWLDSLRSAM